jgi:hemolysin III
MLRKIRSRHDSNGILSSAFHIVGVLLGIAALVLLVVFSAIMGKTLHIVTFAIYGTTLILLYLASSLMHTFAIFKNPPKILKIFDFSAIYLLIAGTYTPMCLVVVGGWLGWALFGVIWGLALLGIILFAIPQKNSDKKSALIYVIMGWISVLAVPKIYETLGINGLLWLGLGGILYTIGAVIFSIKKPNPLLPYFGHHEIWHLFVLTGSLMHFFLMLFSVMSV